MAGQTAPHSIRPPERPSRPRGPCDHTDSARQKATTAFPVKEISEYIDQPDTTVWVDTISPTLMTSRSSPRKWACMRLRSQMRSTEASDPNLTVTPHMSS